MTKTTCYLCKQPVEEPVAFGGRNGVRHLNPTTCVVVLRQRIDELEAIYEIDGKRIVKVESLARSIAEIFGWKTYCESVVPMIAEIEALHEAGEKLIAELEARVVRLRKGLDALLMSCTDRGSLRTPSWGCVEMAQAAALYAMAKGEGKDE